MKGLGIPGGWGSQRPNNLKMKMKSNCNFLEPSGPSGLSLSWFQQHEATRSISTPLLMGC